MKIFLLTLLISSSINAQTKFPFRGIPSAHTVEESKALFKKRAQSVVEYFASKELGVFNRGNGIDFPVKALAKFSLGVDIEKVNAEILNPDAIPYADVGTDFTALSPLCIRNGDYDFALRGWVSLIYKFWDKPNILYPETKGKLLKVLLNQTGNKVATFRKFCGFVKINETENHILLTEGSRYLTNQLWRRVKDDPIYDNRKNGMADFLLRHMSQFLREDFEEFNSRPYLKFTLAAIHNIYEFAEDKPVKEMSKMLLDYLTVKYVSSSKDLRRVVPFCRQPEHRHDLDILENDALSVAMALWAGTLDFVDKLPEGAELTHFDLLGLALGDYRPDDLVLDLIMNANNPQREFMQLYHHLGYEMYFGHEKYLLNAGGKFINQIDAGTGKIDAWAVPISILPSVGGVNKAQLIRIIGDTRDNKKANMCVTKNFACGLNIIIPDEIPETCMEKMDHWTFLNFSKDSCPKKYGFFVAIYSKSCDSLRCKLGGNNFGFFEIQTPEKMNYETFKKKVVDHNSLSKYSSKKWGAYINSHGEKIKFHVNPWKKNIYPIEDERFPFIKGNLKSWPHAWGDFMSSGGRGLLEIKNPYLDKKIIFDVTDPLNPKRSI